MLADYFVLQYLKLGTIHKLRRPKGTDGPFRQKTTFDDIDGGTILSKDDVVF